MLIEDNLGDARLVKQTLLEENFSVESFENVIRLSAGLNRLAQGNVDAVLLDLGLPDSQGIDTFIKAREAAPNVPILIFTSNDCESIALEAIRKGAQEYLVKGKTDGTLLVRSISYAVERKKTELELKESRAQLEIANEKLRVVGGLSRHDIRNKHMVARTNLFLLRKRLGDSTDLLNYLDKADSALVESDKIFDFASIYEKIGVQKLLEVDIGRSFDEAAKLFPNLNSLEVINECQGLKVISDSLLSQLFYNFIDNSLKHGENVSKIRLHFKKDDAGIQLFYEDNGTGISAENKAKLFSEGFTTGKGSGLGLKLVKRMIEVYGWTMTEEGKPGEGVKFVMTIPLKK